MASHTFFDILGISVKIPCAKNLVFQNFWFETPGFAIEIQDFWLKY